MVLQITGEEHFNSVVKDNNVVIVDFYATWCGPCVAIAPKLEEWEKKYAVAPEAVKGDVEEVTEAPNDDDPAAAATAADPTNAAAVAREGPGARSGITFAKVDVDEHSGIASQHGVSAMPTFLIFRKGELVKTIVGANVPKLQAVLEEQAAAA